MAVELTVSRFVNRLQAVISVENRNFHPTSVYFAPSLKGFPWNWVPARSGQKN